jgi:hypothetical protein
MAYKGMTTAEMITVSEPWTTAGTPARGVLEHFPEVAPLLPRLEAAHRALLVTQPQVSKTLATLAEQAAALDQRHDGLGRALEALTTGFALAAPTVAEANALHALHDLLLPAGLSVVQRSYREEAGQVKLLAERLTPAAELELKALPLPGGKTVLDLVREWIQVGTRLGEVEDQRAQEQQAGAKGSSPADIVLARNRWIRAVNAIVNVVALAEVPDDQRETVFAALWDAEKAADRRSGRRGTTEPPVAPGTPETPTTPPA